MQYGIPRFLWDDSADCHMLKHMSDGVVTWEQDQDASVAQAFEGNKSFSPQKRPSMAASAILISSTGLNAGRAGGGS